MGISQQIGASSLIKPGVIDNSTQRPASPYEGQVIFQKDTDAVLYWNGSAWYPAWNTAWGQVGYSARTSNLTNIATSVTEVASVTFTAIAGRRYSITGNINVYKEGSTSYAHALIYNGSTQVARIGLLNVAAGIEAVLAGTCFESPSAGSTTYKLMVLFSANTLNEVRAVAQYPSYIQIQDIGPA